MCHRCITRIFNDIKFSPHCDNDAVNTKLVYPIPDNPENTTWPHDYKWSSRN